MTSASITIEPSTWRREAAERSQRGELARPLRDRDRERVRDHEAADEQRDPGEGEQEALEEGDELVRVGRVLRRLRRAVRTCVPREHRRDVASSCASLTPGLAAATAIWSSLPTLSNSRCAVGRSKPASVAPPIEIDGAELDEPETVSICSTGPRPGRRSCRRSRSPPPSRCRVSITTSFAPGPVALDERERVERRLAVRDREAEIGCAAEDDRLAVVADQLSPRRRRRRSRPRRRRRRDRRQDALVERRRRRAAASARSNAALPVIDARRAL